MGVNGYRVIDADGHLFEPPSLFQQFCDKYLDPPYTQRLQRVIDEVWKGHPTLRTPLYTYGSRFPAVRTDWPLGVENPIGRIERQGYKMGAKGAVEETMWDPTSRLKDMDVEGIDVSVLFPSGTPGFCHWEDTAFEAAIYRAYNRAVNDFCKVAPDRLKWVGVVSMRDSEAAAQEIRRAAQEPLMVGLYLSPQMDEKLLDRPAYYPLWEEAQKFDLPIIVHGNCARGPYGIGTFDMGDNLFLQHSSSFGFQAMRAMAALVGGGVMEKFPRLRFGFMESGCGWVPYWLDRLDEHAEQLPKYVPFLTRKPSDLVKRGTQCFVACDPDETSLEFVVQQLGEDRIVYASDYPHWDCKFPDSARVIAERDTLSKSARKNILSDNALRLYPRLSLS